MRNIFTGVYAHATVHVVRANAVGRVVLNDMEGKMAAECVFQRANQVTMDIKSSVRIDGDVLIHRYFSSDLL